MALFFVTIFGKIIISKYEGGNKMALIICPECNKEISDKAITCPHCGHPMQTNQTDTRNDAPIRNTETQTSNTVPEMKAKWATGKLTISIISIVLFFLVAFQSCGAGMANAMTSNGESSGSFGFIVALFMLIAGIVGITTKSSTKKLGSISCVILYWFSFIIAYIGAGTFSDLKIWGFIAFVFGIVHLLSISHSTKTVIISSVCSALLFIIFSSSSPDNASSEYEPMRADSGSVESANVNKPTSTGNEPKESEESADMDDNMIDFATERCYIKYTGHEVSADYDGNPCLIFYYDFTNNSDVDTSADIATYIKAFQDGVQIESAFYSPDEENISYSNSSKQIQPGVTINVAQVFELTSDSDVDVKASESFSLKDLEDSMTLSIK